MTEAVAPMVGRIIAINVKVGDTISENDSIATIEAMKLEMPIPSPASGTVKEIKVSVGDQVEADQVIAVIE